MGLEDYKPGYYIGRGKDLARLSEEMIKAYELSYRSRDDLKSSTGIHPCISVSRKIGVGALEVADKVGERLQMRVVDREFMEYLKEHTSLKESQILTFDERMPRLGEEILRMLSGKKAFLKGKYVKGLAKVILWAAKGQPCIFVGRGAHLILPRAKVLAVRIIAPIEFRIKRVSTMMKAGYSETERILKKLDKEQKEFFKKLYGKTGSSPYEFDLVLNREFIEDINTVSNIIVDAYKGKFIKKEVGQNVD